MRIASTHFWSPIAAAVFLGTATWSTAQTLPAPKDAVVLRIEGAVERTNADGAAELDLAMLLSMPATEFATTTIWTEGEQVFTGVSLADLVAELGISGSRIRAIALNDYAVEIPLSDAVDGGPIVAYHMNGETMSRRDKGPLWVVYPYDSNPDYKTETIYSRSIWQLVRIEALE